MNPPDLRAAAHAASLAGAFVVTVVVAALWSQWFVQDEWDWILRFLPGQGLDPLRPHNGHLVALPLLAFRGLYEVVGLQTYWPYLLLGLVVHLVAGHVLWRVMLRCGCGPWIATALVALFLVGTPAAGNVFLAMQVGWSAPVALGLGALLLLDRPDPGTRRNLGAAALLVLALACNGLALALVAGCGLLVFLRRGAAGLGPTLLPVVAAYGLWWLAWGRDGPRPDGVAGVLRAPAEAWAILTGAIDASTLTGLGVPVALGLGVWLVAQRRPLRSEAAPAAALVLAAGVFALMVGLTRADQPADTPRYAAVTWAFLLPAVGLAVGDAAQYLATGLARAGTHRLVAAGVLAGTVLGVSGLGGFVLQAQRDEARETGLQRKVSATARLVATGGYDPDARVDEDSASPLQVRHVAALADQGKLP